MANYHLRPDGNDSLSGTSFANGWLTFDKAAATMAAGDTLTVNAGTYSEWVRWDKSGTLANPITIQASGTVWLDGNYVYPSNVNRAGATYPPFGTAEDVSFSGLFEIQDCTHVHVDGINVKRSKGRGVFIYGPNANHKAGVRFQNAQIIDCRHAGLTVDGIDDLVISGITIVNHGSYAPFIRPTVLLNHPAAINIKGCNDATVYDCLVHDGWGEGIILSKNAIGGVIYNCTFYDMMSPLLYFEGSQQWEAYGNLMYITEGGLQYDVDGTPGICILSEDPKNLLEDTTQIDGIYCHDNIIIGTNDGVRIGRGQEWPDGWPVNRNVYIYNNTIIQVRNGKGLNIHSLSLNENVNVYDNVFMQTAAGDIATAPTDPTNIHIGPNAWSVNPNDSDTRHDDDLIGTFGLTDPYMELLAGETPNIAALVPGDGSALINASTTTDSTHDFRGNERIGTPDVGALEYTGDAPPEEGDGGMITVEDRTELLQAGGNTAIFSHTHPAVTDDALLVVVHGLRVGSDTPFTFTLCTYGGDTLTLLGTQQNSGTNRNMTTAVFYVAGADTGSNGLGVAASTTISQWAVQAISLSGVDQTTPLTIDDQGTTIAPWAATATVDAGSQIWWVVTARGDSTAVEPGTGNTEEYDIQQTSGGADTDLRASAVYRAYPDGGSSTLTVPTGPQNTRRPAWIFFVVNAAEETGINISPGAASVASAAANVVLVLGSMTVVITTAAAASVATAPTVDFSSVAGITVSPGAATVASAAAIGAALQPIGSAAAHSAAAIGEVTFFTRAIGIFLTVNARRRVFTLRGR